VRSKAFATLATAVASGLVIAPPAMAAPSGLAALRAKGATTTGALHRASVPVTLTLTPRHTAALHRAAATGGLARGDFDRRFAPSKATVATVRRWAAAHHLRVASVSANRLLVRVAGSATDVGRAFGTRLRTYRSGGTRFFAPATKAALPAGVAAHTTAVLGLSNLGRAGLDAHRSALPVGVPSTYGPKELAALYDAPATATGAGQRVAVIAEGDLTQPRQDLVTFEDTFGLPHVTWNQIQVGAPSSDTSGSDEWDLDTQYSTGMAPGVSQLDVYDGASLSNDDILATINRWVTDDASRQASFSAGECETLAFATGFTAALDTVLAQAAAQGQTLFVSSGDTGVFCSAVVGVNGVPAGIPSAEYPASSPYAIGVGGTTVLGPGPSEIAWYAGGGGTSVVEDTPSWQANAGGSFAGVRRGVPDVALDADPTSGYQVIVGGQPETIGGTSASAPAWQGIWARTQGAKGGALGFAGPVIYGTEPASAFHDIVVGANGAPATPGWDYATGRGTPDIAAFVNGA
jgi:subtilase family serine protease